jgi:CRISPR-associated protein Csm3
MFKILHNQARLGFEINPITPLLIKSGRVSFNPTRPDMEFVRSVTVFGEVPYLPGSSLKGLMRSYGERILRSISLINCDITLKNKACFNGGTYDRKMDVTKKYKHHCYACRTFGSTEVAGRLTLTDAYPWPVSASTEQIEDVVVNIEKHVPTANRTNVRIDRRTGTSAGSALFEAEVVSGGTFYGEANLTNYQLWQLALLGLIIRDINSGLLRLGSAKARGLGRIKITINNIEFQQYGVLSSSGQELRGIGCLDQETVNHYGLAESDLIKMPDAMIENEKESVPGLLAVYQAPSKSNSIQNRTADDIWQDIARTIINNQCWKEFLKSGGYDANSQ